MNSMKRIFVFFAVVNAVLLGYAQKPENSSSDKLKAKIDNINQQIGDLKTEIESVYQNYSNKKVYSDDKTRNDSFAKLQEESESLRKQLRQLNCDIDSLQKEYMVVDNLREYYQNGNIDSLFSHADKESLAIDKRILGSDYPKVIDELQILLDYGELLRKEYKAEQASQLWKLDEVDPCATKERLSELLSVQKDITSEVEYWIKDERHTLYDFVKFRNTLLEYYSVSIETDFPYLAGKVFEKLEWNSQIK